MAEDLSVPTPRADNAPAFAVAAYQGVIQTLRVLVNPLVIWAWFAFPLFSLGTVLAMFYRPHLLIEPAFERGLGVAGRA